MHMDVYANAQKDLEEHKSHFRGGKWSCWGIRVLFICIAIFIRYVYSCATCLIKVGFEEHLEHTHTK